MSMRIATFAAALLLSGCASTMPQDPPALLIDPDAETHAELVRIVSAALKVPSVTIADDALTRDSMLVIERRPARDATGRRLTGRDFDKPEQFQLTTDGERCTLLHVRTGRKYLLTNARCEEEVTGD